MTINSFKRARAAVAFFISAIMSVAVLTSNFPLAVAAVVTGMVLMHVIKSKTKGVLVDERVLSLSEKASRAAYTVNTTVLGLAAFVLTFFAQTTAPYLEALATIFSYLTLFSIAVYSVAFYYYNRKHGVNDEE